MPRRTQYKMDAPAKNQLGGCGPIVLLIILAVGGWSWWTDRLPDWLPWLGDDVAQMEPTIEVDTSNAEQRALLDILETIQYQRQHCKTLVECQDLDVMERNTRELLGDAAPTPGPTPTALALTLDKCNSMYDSGLFDEGGEYHKHAIYYHCTDIVEEYRNSLGTPTPDVAYEAARKANVAIYLTAKANAPDTLVSRLQSVTEGLVNSSKGTMYSVVPSEYAPPTAIPLFNVRDMYRDLSQ